MKTDTQLRKEVLEALEGESGIAASTIGVAVNDGAVTLSGLVPTHTEKYAAERAVLRVSGVKAVAEEIQVKLLGFHQYWDEEVAETVSRLLQSSAWVSADIQGIVEDGWVTLQGEATSESQREAAVNTVRSLVGVKGISNLITLKPTVQPAALPVALAKPRKRREETIEQEGEYDEVATFLPL